MRAGSNSNLRAVTSNTLGAEAVAGSCRLSDTSGTASKSAVPTTAAALIAALDDMHTFTGR